MLHFIWMCIIGLVAGALAKLIMPGKDPGGMTCHDAAWHCRVPDRGIPWTRLRLVRREPGCRPDHVGHWRHPAARGLSSVQTEHGLSGLSPNFRRAGKRRNCEHIR